MLFLHREKAHRPSTAWQQPSFGGKMSQEERAGQEPALKVTSVQTPACPHSHLHRLTNTTGLPLPKQPLPRTTGGGTTSLPALTKGNQREDLLFFFFFPKVKFLPLRHHTLKGLIGP